MKLRKSLFLATLAAASPFLLRAQTEKTSTGLAMQEARAEGLKMKAKKAYYPANQWDLGDLPAYQPKETVTGTIRLWGSNYIVDGNVGEYWEKAFRKFHPDVKFDYPMLKTRAAVPSLVFGVSDLGMGRKITTEELQLYQRYKNHDPLEITIATGSYNVTGWQPGFGIVVSKGQSPHPHHPRAARRHLRLGTPRRLDRHRLASRICPRTREKPPHLGPARTDRRMGRPAHHPLRPEPTLPPGDRNLRLDPARQRQME